MSPLFILNTVVSVQASTEDEAAAILELFFPGDLCWAPLGERVEVFSPGWPPIDVCEDEPDPECSCPPDLVARGGFRGGCPVHS